MLMPAFCQTTVSQPLTANQTPFLYAGAMVASADLKASLFEAEGSGSAISAYIEPVAPAPSAAVRSLVQPETRQPKPKMKEWKLSLLALAAAHSADAATSWNKRELNPMLSPSGGAFGAQTLAVKCAVSIGSIGLQAILLRSRPQLAKMFARLNFMETGIIGATAIHNSFVPGR
jgi:hypothetical protein